MSHNDIKSLLDEYQWEGTDGTLIVPVPPAPAPPSPLNGPPAWSNTWINSAIHPTPSPSSVNPAPVVEPTCVDPKIVALAKRFRVDTDTNDLWVDNTDEMVVLLFRIIEELSRRLNVGLPDMKEPDLISALTEAKDGK